MLVNDSLRTIAVKGFRGCKDRAKRWLAIEMTAAVLMSTMVCMLTADSNRLLHDGDLPREETRGGELPRAHD